MLPLLAQDKANHSVYGYVIFVIGALLARFFGLPSQLGGWLLTTLAATGKEIYDLATGRGTADPRDAIATLLGAVPASALIWE